MAGSARLAHKRARWLTGVDVASALRSRGGWPPRVQQWRSTDVANASAAEALVGELTGQGHHAVAFRRGCRRPRPRQGPVRAGGRRVRRADLLASNAGVEHFGAVESITEADVDRVFSINVAGQLFATQAAVAVMDRGGRILLTSSISARVAVYAHTLYAASKAAVSAMVLNLAPRVG